jgi:16S rRNA (guanine1207-N2)-methyltransferase
LHIADDPYYQFVERHTTVDGEDYVWFSRPGMGEQQDRLTSALLLAESIDVALDARVLCMHCDSGLAGIVASRQARLGQVTLLDCSNLASKAARLALAANEVANAEVLTSDCGNALLGQRPGDHLPPCDCALALLPKGRAVWEQTVLDAAALLRTGGALHMAGANRAGIKSAAKYMQRVFGQVNVLTYRGGCRVVRAVKTDTIKLPASDYHTWRTLSAQVQRETIEYVTKPGLFAWSQLDGGTRLLIETLHEHPLGENAAVLDVGCGAGILTLVAARQTREGSVTGVDVDCRAVEAARRTLAHNNVSNAQILASDCIEAVADRTFDAVITNPPFHQKQATTCVIAAQIIQDAARILDRHGRLYVVGNRFLRYGPLIERAFGQVSLLRQTDSFGVWTAEKRH